MSTLRNSVQLIGNLGNTPEIFNLESGKKLAKFNLATNSYYYNANGEKVSETQWHRIVAWGKQAELVEKYVSKGKEIAIKGKLSYGSYTATDGTKRYSTDIVCDEIVLFKDL